MERDTFKQLEDWKQNKNKKPLIIQGARQVGKTWLMLEFGKRAYEKTAYFNFETNYDLQSLFKQGLNIENILSGLAIIAGFQIKNKNTLIVFDEIQACPEAISSLKYFNEQAPELEILAAGSLLGVAIHKGISFPVGKVDFLTLYPLNFHEFLNATGQEQLLELLKTKNIHLISVFKQRFIDKLREFYFVGGMPEAVMEFVNTKDLIQVRKIQLNILNAYENDFSKHAPIEQLPRIRLVWQSIIGQLAKENSKFIYNVLRPGARAKDFEMAIEWLKDAGLIHKVYRINNSAFPLAAYAIWSDFKIYLNDVGLLGAMGTLSPEILLRGNNLFTEFKGRISEQFILQQMLSTGMKAFYWNPENAMSEVDFMVQIDNKIIPIEVKAAENVRSKSLRVYYEKYNSDQCIRTSLADYEEQDWMKNIPLFGFLAWLEQEIIGR